MIFPVFRYAQIMVELVRYILSQM